jgi:hypothetical protein
MHMNLLLCARTHQPHLLPEHLHQQHQQIDTPIRPRPLSFSANTLATHLPTCSNPKVVSPTPHTDVNAATTTVVTAIITTTARPQQPLVGHRMLAHPPHAGHTSPSHLHPSHPTCCSCCCFSRFPLFSHSPQPTEWWLWSSSLSRHCRLSLLLLATATTGHTPHEITFCKLNKEQHQQNLLSPQSLALPSPPLPRPKPKSQR